MKWNRKWLWLGFFLIGPVSALAKGTPAYLTLSLSELTRTAMQNSPKLEAARLSWKSAEAEANSMGAAEFPRLGLNGNYFYQTYVPDLSIVPNAPAAAFGESNNWSVWATLNWNLWDFRSQHNMANSATAVFQSQELLYHATERQVKLAVRLAYFQAQINLEQVRLLGESLQVAQAQYADIVHQAKFGTASRMDRLSSHQEVLSYEREFRQAQANHAQALRDLFDLVGQKEPVNFNAPLDQRMEEVLPEGIAQPTVWLSMDPVKNSQTNLQKEAAVPPADTDPQLQTYAYLADSARFSAAAVQSELLPKVTLSAQAGYENPDGPILQTEQQNIVSLSLSMPIFDWGQIVSDSEAKEKQAEVYQKNWSQAKADLWRDWNKGGDALRSLRFQQKINDTAVSETQELARLTYKAYRAGTVRFLEVQTANFQSLNAKVLAVSNDVQMLMQLSVLSSLAGNKE